MIFKIHIKSIANIQAQQVLQLFTCVQKNAWSFFLDSCEQTEMGGRYDILVSQPCFTYTFKNGKHCLEESYDSNNVVSQFYQKNPDRALAIVSACPYANLAEFQKQFTQLFDLSSMVKLDLPFILGAVGAFAYDGNIHTDKIRDDHPNQYALPDVSVGYYQSSVIFDNKLSTLHICSIEPAFIQQIQDLLNKFCEKPVVRPFSLTTPWKSNVSEEDYRLQFTKIEAYLQSGDCYQVNFAQRFSAHYVGDEWHAYTKLRQFNKAPFSAFARLPTSAILSLSPERFLSINNRKVETKPIKGTRRRSQITETDKLLADELLNSDKDKAENLMIVDLLRNDLSKFCKPHSVNVPTLFALESYPAVHHLVSTVVGELKPAASVYDLFKGAFPGGSITGAPKVRAMQIIQELEPDKRAIYCGSIAYIGIRNDMDSNICIRTLLAENETIFCWAGGGIVIDSNAADEYQESLDKVAKILPVLWPKQSTRLDSKE